MSHEPLFPHSLDPTVKKKYDKKSGTVEQGKINEIEYLKYQVDLKNVEVFGSRGCLPFGH